MILASFYSITSEISMSIPTAIDAFDNNGEEFLSPMHLILPADSISKQGALYLGDLGAAVDEPLLRAHSITHIVQVLDVPWLPLEDEGFTYTRVHIDDKPTLGLLSPYLKDACLGISTALGQDKNVLVHCQQGISRSASIVIAYLIQSRQLSYIEAFEFVRERRSCIKPNKGFVVALKEWEEIQRQS